MFLSADQTRPQQAEKAGLAVPGSDFTYAVGKLVLWSRSVDVAKGDEALKANAFEKLSIADPKAAPYGEAAMETLKALKVYDAIQPKIVQGAASRRRSSSSTPATPNSASSRFRNSQSDRRFRAGWCRRICIRRSARTPCC